MVGKRKHKTRERSGILILQKENSVGNWFIGNPIHAPFNDSTDHGMDEKSASRSP